jgi:hypothetical protein
MAKTPAERVRERLLRRPPRPCAVAGCLQPTHALSQHCIRHKRGLLRHGGVNARAIRLTELRPFTPCVRNFLHQNRGHPALLAVYADLDRMLYEATLAPVRHRPRAQDWQQRMRYDLARLHQGGVTGAEVFELVATLFMFSEYNQHTLAPWSRPFWFSAARLTLNLRSRDRDCPLVNKHAASRVNSKTLETIGRRITVTCAPVFRAMKETIEATAGRQQEQRQAVEKLLAEEPFKIL